MTIDRRGLLQGAAAAGLLLAARRGQAQGAPTLAPPSVHKAVQDGLPQSIERIQRWIRQPSVSATGQGVKECCDLTMELLREAGFQTVKKVPTKGHPGIFATYDAGAKRSLGLYFMYDVQPVEEKEWQSPPWKAALVDLPDFGKVIMGRGAVNQKGPEGAFLSALHAIRKAGEKLPVNLVLCAEGEEEIASPHFGEVVRSNQAIKPLSQTQGVLMPSAGQSETGIVDVSLGAKGIVYVELISDGAKWGRGPRDRDVHSSLAAVVDSPVWRLVDALKTLRSPDGNEPAIDGIGDAIRPTSAAFKKLYDEITAREDEALFKKSVTVDRWIADLDERRMWERLGERPTVNIDGIWGGYTGDGPKTILPKRATAKIDFRLVPDMTAKDVLAKLRKHLDKRGFTDIEIHELGSYDPNETALASPIVQTEIGYYKAKGVAHTVTPRLAGSWPGYLFTGKPISRGTSHFGMGFGDRAHSKNEFYVVTPPPGAKFVGLDGAVSSFADFLYALAKT